LVRTRCSRANKWYVSRCPTRCQCSIFIIFQNCWRHCRSWFLPQKHYLGVLLFHNQVWPYRM